jgi:DNA-binding CsgD family transcriptional regulator
MSPSDQLSKREWDVVEVLLEGKSNKLIADSLSISERTVEFHLKNIYAKMGVSTRVELILKLGKATGDLRTGRLGPSTVEPPGRRGDNGEAHNREGGRARPFRSATPPLERDPEMKTSRKINYILAGTASASLTGLLWLAAFRRFGNMPTADIRTWILPLIVTWALIGLLVGLTGRRAGRRPLRVAIATALGTGIAPVAILPIMGFVVLPIGKLAEAFGLIDPARIQRDAASTLVVLMMLAIWLLLAVVVGYAFLYLGIRKLAGSDTQVAAGERAT